MEEARRSPLIVICAAVIAVAACFATWLALVSKGLLCETACRTSLFTAQLLVAVAGLVPVGVLLYAALRGRRELALVSFFVTILVYLAWGALNDAAVHGWHNLKVF